MLMTAGDYDNALIMVQKQDEALSQMLEGPLKQQMKAKCCRNYGNILLEMSKKRQGDTLISTAEQHFKEECEILKNIGDLEELHVAQIDLIFCKLRRILHSSSDYSEVSAVYCRGGEFLTTFKALFVVLKDLLEEPCMKVLPKGRVNETRGAILKAKIYGLLGDYDSAVKELTNLLPKLDENEQYDQITVLNNLALHKSNINNHQEAIHHLEEAFKKFKQMKMNDKFTFTNMQFFFANCIRTSCIRSPTNTDNALQALHYIEQAKTNHLLQWLQKVSQTRELIRTNGVLLEFAIIYDDRGPEYMIVVVFTGEDRRVVIFDDRAQLQALIVSARFYTMDGNNFASEFKIKPRCSFLKHFEDYYAIKHYYQQPDECQIPSHVQMLGDIILPKIYPLISNYEHVYVVPDDDLWYVPWTALEYNSTFMGLQHYFHIIPSIRVATILNKSLVDRSHTRKKALLFVNPQSTAEAEKEQLTVEEIVTLSSLKWQTLEGEKVSKDSFCTSLQGPTYFHIVTHGTHAKGGESTGLQFDDIDFDPDDLMDAKARNLIVSYLAACKTGQATYNGDGIDGFAWQFWRMAVPCLIVSLWNIHDEYSIAFAKEFYQNLLIKKESPAIAFGNAVRSCCNILPFKYWSAFQYWGV